MGENGTAVRLYHGSLDPRAQEFRPQVSPSHQPQPTTTASFFLSSPPPPPPPPPTLTLFHPFSAPYVPYPAAPPPSSAVFYGPPLRPSSSTATRALLLSSVPSDVSAEAVRRDMEAFGDVRAVQMEGLLHEGTVIVHFYDLRHARRAMREVREQHMQQQCRLRYHFGSAMPGGPLPHPPPPSVHGLVAGRVVWAEFVVPVPAANSIHDGQNQGSLVLFNLDPNVTADALRHIFEAFGPVMELRDTPYKKHQRFVEFYDVRDAAKALQEMNGKEILGKNVIIEFSRPGGYSRKLLHSSGGVSYFAPPAPPPPPPPPFPTQLPPPHMITSPTVATEQPHQAEAVPVEASMRGLTLGDEVEDDRTDSPFLKKSSTGKKKHGKAVSGVKQQKKPWRTRPVKKMDSRFDITVGETSNAVDSRTTLMIKNIPNKYSQKLLLNMLDNHCISCNEQIGEESADQPFSSYDFVYLPIDFNNKCNVGYGFVNMTSPQAARRLYKAFHLRHWEVFNSRKICEVTYARIQGLEALKEHFRNSKFPCEVDHYLPVVFMPPQDGRLLTDPIPVVGKGGLGKQLQPSSSEALGDDDDELRRHSGEEASNGDSDDL
ncbi:hypothetical protein SAY87_024297 [Trapa incisa]|uniref:RRM domain-containing protein n=1 Tax=Trapa incisa TaxID=236973 RepID=A0AAN7JF22_9MYRT|nr:hypothetical protein SAY87_024297 [Trapa incisa]